MKLSRWLASTVATLVLAAPASAARIPTADESAALNGLIAKIDAECTLAEHSVSLPLVTDDGTWGRVTAGCGDASQGGAAFRGRGVWAHRSSATATDWAIVGSTEASRIPPCSGKNGLLELVPEAVVRDLREECAGPPSGYRPSPDLVFSVFRNATHEYDSIGASIYLSSKSEVNGGGFGLFSIDRTGPPTASGSKPKLRDMTRAFGKPRRTRCGATWTKLALKATACASGAVTKLTMGEPWRLSPDSEDREHPANAYVRVGDTIELAHYLDPQLAKLGADQRFRLAKLRIGSADVTATVVTRAGRITAFETSIKQRH
ncbi:hypothetical protein OM076_11755 [Solirubrobacter ginsenosidimutans]|uniref:Uncharacterized protein n=1 Tax=Solirubrobacter ginsenosidimutans TaxID=490573 RepID=A0A9X3MSS6_9ACTN|nr:hypothetical protein [Solirubrobacter ginsenosidimutans]MDA0160942.1 hypothetical protein [Solirubrobacter ginsenosidimutans]